MSYDLSQRAAAALEESAVLRLERKRLLLEARNLRELRRLARTSDAEQMSGSSILAAALQGQARP